MMISLVVLSIGLVTLWFALEGLRQRVHRLEERLVDQVEPLTARSSSSPQPENTLPTWDTPTIEGPVHPIEPERAFEQATERAEPQLDLIKRIAEQGGWEKLIGGSWLNKLGVLAFVIGVGFLLRYSFGDMGPRGKIFAGIAISVSMIVAGVILERRRDFPVYYGRGLIGGGWASLYFTTYAAYGIESARILHSPTMATVLLLAVATGMIIHSLGYRSEVVTGLAYFLAFVALALTPMPTFAVVASLPLAISLLFLAYRFEWNGMAVAGVVVTYSAYLLSVASTPPSSPTDQIVLAFYWIIFEAFDLFSLARTKDSRTKASVLPAALFPLNANAFVGASMLRWNGAIPLSIMFGVGALLFFVDTLFRKWLASPREQQDQAPTMAEVTRGYEASLTAATLLATAAIVERFTGLKLDIALLLEAEMLILAGLQLELLFPRILGSLLMTFPISRILFDFFVPQTMTPADFMLKNWSIVALLAVGALYTNRPLLKDQWKVLFGYPAAFLLALVIDVEITARYHGLAWMVLGIALFELGLAMRASDLRMQGYGTGILGLLALLLPPFLGETDFSALSLGISALLTWSIALEAYRLHQPIITDAERNLVRRLATAAGSALVATLLWRELPISLVAFGWSLLAAALMAVGARWDERDLRFESGAIALLAFVRCWQVNFDIATMHYGFSDAIVTSALVITTLYSLSLLQKPASGEQTNTGHDDLEENLRLIDSHARAAFACAAIILLTGLLYQRIDAKALTEAWALEAVLLLVVGFLRKDQLGRVSGLLLLGICVLKLFLYDLSNLETLARICSFILSGILLLGVSLIYARFYEHLKPYLSEEPNKKS
jgi:hypothetical protein